MAVTWGLVASRGLGCIPHTCIPFAPTHDLSTSEHVFVTLEPIDHALAYRALLCVACVRLAVPSPLAPSPVLGSAMLPLQSGSQGWDLHTASQHSARGQASCGIALGGPDAGCSWTWAKGAAS